MTGPVLAYFILWRVWSRLFMHPDWTSRTDSLDLVSRLRGQAAIELSYEEQEQVYQQVDYLRMMEVV